MKRWFASILVVSACAGPVPAWSAPTTDQLLPVATKGYIAFPNVDDFRERWRQTQLGQLVNDPIMKPFADDLQRQIREKFIMNRFSISLTWEEIAEACGGELCIAAIRPEHNEGEKAHAAVMIVDVTGRQDAAQKVLDETAKQLEEQGAQRRTEEIQSATIVIYDLPRQRGQTHADQVVQGLLDDILIMGDHETVCARIVDRYLSKVGDDSLASLPNYQRVMDRVQAEAGAMKPQVRWFAEPFGFAEVLRAARRGPQKRRKDMLAILNTQGFDAIQGVGGWVHLSTNDHEILHRTFVFAPGEPDRTSRFRLAARMLNFPNTNEWNWPEWVPRELASATSFRVKAQDAFEYSKTLVNAIAEAEDFFEDFLDSIKSDPAGPQIDVREDFVAHFGEQITVVSDHTFPITPQSERMLVAITVTNEEAVKTTVHDALVSDPDARQLDVEGNTVWEILDSQDTAAPDLELTIDGIDPIGLAPVPDDEEPRILRNSAITVANGHFMVATHVDLLRRIFAERQLNDRLTMSEDVQLVNAHLDRVGAGMDCLRGFTRTDEAYRPTYELIRQGKMPESESMLGRLLNRLLGPDEEDVLREQTIDGKQLPDFQAVRRYLGPAGLFIRSEPDGWYATGLLLNKQALYLDGRQSPALGAELNLAPPSVR